MKMLTKVIDLTTLVLGLILGTRVLLKVLGASSTAPFVKWVYVDLSRPLLAPFLGIFPAPTFGKSGIIDIPAFFALVVYLASGYMLSAGLESLSRSIHLKIKPNNLLRIAHKDGETTSPNTSIESNLDSKPIQPKSQQNLD